MDDFTDFMMFCAEEQEYVTDLERRRMAAKKKDLLRKQMEELEDGEDREDEDDSSLFDN